MALAGFVRFGQFIDEAHQHEVILPIDEMLRLDCYRSRSALALEPHATGVDPLFAAECPRDRVAQLWPQALARHRQKVLVRLAVSDPQIAVRGTEEIKRCKLPIGHHCGGRIALKHRTLHQFRQGWRP